MRRCGPPHCGARKTIDFRGPDVCAVCRVALPSRACAPIAAGVAVRRCDGATVWCAVRRCAGARYHTVAAENPSILGLLAYVQCAELPCRAASASWAATGPKPQHRNGPQPNRFTALLIAIATTQFLIDCEAGTSTCSAEGWGDLELFYAHSVSSIEQ